ncbi:MAG: hypothetical protein WCO78_01680 [Candidatus Roizmanbacteria bacterium]
MNATDSATLKIIGETSGAFFGAFFAFMFGLVTYYWTKWVERQNKDYNAMVKLEGVLNEHLNVSSKNIFLMHGSMTTLSAGAMTYNILRNYRLVEDIELSFLDLDLINKYFDYRDSINALNNDFETANKATDILREVVMSDKGNEVTIKANAQNLIGNMESLIKVVLEKDNETKSLLCLIRIKIQKDKPGLLGVCRLCWKPHKPTKDKITSEMTKLNEEINETKRISAQSIAKVMAC